MSPSPLRIAFVPEHFSTPLAFAVKKFNLEAILHPYPSGTGAMISALCTNEVDVAIGLTEGFIAGLGKPDVLLSDGSSGGSDGGYRLIGTYVTTPLCWAILAGAQEGTPSSVAELKDARIGVSRIGSGSHVMGYVLADSQGWLSGSGPWASTRVLDNFAGLIKGVGQDGTADFFMWETFTSSRAIKRGDIKKVGEIYTPWASWLIVASTKVAADDPRIEDMFAKVDEGVKQFREQQDEAVEHICSTMDYSEEDARKWLTTVKFQDGVKGVDISLVDGCIAILRKAGVLEEGKGMGSDEMVAIKR